MNRLFHVLPEVVARLRATECSKHHPVVVMVPSTARVEPLTIALRGRGIDAAVGTHQMLAPVRVYSRSQMGLAVDFLTRFGAPDRDTKIIPVNL